MKKVKILTVIMAIFALGASVNAQSVNVLNVNGGYDQSAIYSFNVKLNPGDTASVMTTWSDTSTMLPMYKIKNYTGLTDTFKTIKDSVDDKAAINGIVYKTNLVFQCKMIVKRKGLADTIIYSNQLRFSPKPSPTLFVSKASGPYVCPKGAVTTYNIQSNTPIVVKQFAAFSDSNKVFPAGSIYQYTIPAGSYLWNDTVKNLTTNSFVGNTFTGARKTIKLGVYIVTASQIGQKPNGFMKTPAYKNGVLTVTSPTVTNLSKTWAKCYVRQTGTTTWLQFSKTVIFLGGYGVDTAVFSATLAAGKYDLMITDSNTYGKYISNVLPVDFSVPPQSCTIESTSSVNTTSGTATYAVNISLQNGNYIDLYAKATQDTLSSVAQSPDYRSPRITQSGVVTFTFTGLSAGWWYFKAFGYDKNNKEYHTSYTQKVFVKFGADVKPFVIKEDVKVYPNPTNTSEGFTVSCTSNKPETLTMFDATGKKVYEAIVSNNDLVKPNVPAGLYTYKLGNTTGRVLFH